MTMSTYHPKPIVISSVRSNFTETRVRPRLSFSLSLLSCYLYCHIFEPQHEISNNVVCGTSKDSDQPAHMRSLIRAFASRLNIL